MKRDNKRPRRGIPAAAAFLISAAAEVAPSVLWLALAQVAVGVALHLLELTAAPAILSAVGAGEPRPLAALILGFTLGLMLVHGLEQYLALNVKFGRIHIRSELGDRVHQQYCRTSYPHVEDPDFLALGNRATEAARDNHQPAERMWSTLVDLLTHLVCFGLYLLLLSGVSPALLAFTALTAVAGYFSGERLRRWRYDHRQEEESAMQQVSYAFMKSRDRGMLKDVRIFGLQDWLTELCGKAVALFRDFHSRSERLCLWADGIDLVLAFLRNGLAYGYLVALCAAGELGAPRFLLYFSAVGGFTAWVTGLLNDFSTLRKQSAEIVSMMDFLEYPEPFRFGDGAPLPVQKDRPYTLELRDISFRYPGAGEDTLSHIDLTLRPGEKLAVVGLNGAGKTTLIKLLCGFYDPTGGQVLLNGQDIRQYDRRDYYQHFTAVFQHFSLLAGTVAENVAQGSRAIDRDRVERCLEQAGLLEKVRSLPQGAETLLDRRIFDEATELSGGELQRLMLARALYKASPIVVLDEPTAALDPIAESEIYRRYSDMTRGRTAVFISHRLASTRFCDRILLLEGGGIAEEGTHRELMALGGGYARLFGIQSRYYREGGVDRG